jgi:hypothetical protein
VPGRLPEDFDGADGARLQNVGARGDAGIAIVGVEHVDVSAAGAGDLKVGRVFRTLHRRLQHAVRIGERRAASFQDQVPRRQVGQGQVSDLENVALPAIGARVVLDTDEAQIAHGSAAGGAVAVGMIAKDEFGGIDSGD